LGEGGEKGEEDDEVECFLSQLVDIGEMDFDTSETSGKASWLCATLRGEDTPGLLKELEAMVPQLVAALPATLAEIHLHAGCESPDLGTFFFRLERLLAVLAEANMEGHAWEEFDYDATIGYIPKDGSMSLHAAILLDSEPCVRGVLKSAGVNAPQVVESPVIHADDMETMITPLVFAAYECSEPGVVAALIEAGADANKPSGMYKHPPLAAALHNKSKSVGEAIARILIMAGADPRWRDENTEEEPISITQLAQENGFSKELVEFLTAA